jgi:tripartite-type tricarboxylate transporter receptor subunit TctC
MSRAAQLTLYATLSAVFAAPLAAKAQTYPTKPVRMIMTVAGGADVIARLVAQGLTGALGQPFIVESQSGAGGSIGAEMVARAAPDGYTIMLSSVSTQVMNGFLSKNSRFDPIKDFTPITKVAEPILLVVSNPSLPVSSIKELIDYAKRNPGKLSYGTSGIGTTHHLSAAMITTLTGIDWLHVPYKGGPPVLTDLMGGQIQIGFTILATMTPFMNSGKIKILAVNNSRRYPVVGDIPTVSEQLPGYEAPPVWMGYFGPAGLPQPIVRRLHDEIVKTVTQSEVRAKAQDIGLAAATSTPEELADTVKRDIAVVAKLVKAAGIQPE